MTTSITLDPAFGWVLFECVFIGFQMLIEGYFVGYPRKKYFSKAFFEKHFPELKGNPPQNGYPDMGSGKFAEKLSLEEWIHFNNYQRAHYNFLEGIATILIALLVCGVFHPQYAVRFGLVYIVGRTLYGLGYRSKGPKGRAVGALVLNIGLLGLLVGAFQGAFAFGGGINGLIKIFKM